jgi:hypothetical protein
VTISIPDNPTLVHIDELNNAPATTLVTLWTMQQPGAVQQLCDRGWYSPDPEFSLIKYGKSGKRGAYEWMQEQMRQRLIGYNGELPIWMLLSRPTQISRAGDQLLRVEVPKERMLIGFYKPWEYLTQIMECLERSGNDWPPSSPTPYFAASSDDERQPVPCRVKCQASWEKMFDLTLARRPGFRWSHCLQAMVPILYDYDVRECVPMSSVR